MGNKTILNPIVYVNNPKVWDLHKSMLLNGITTLNKLSDFIQYHLSTNFKYLIFDEKCKKVIKYDLNGKLSLLQSSDINGHYYKFELVFHFPNHPEDFTFVENEFRTEVKLKDREKKCTVLNKKI